MKSKKFKIILIVLIFLIPTIVLFFFAKQATVKYIKISGDGEFSHSFSILDHCIYFKDESKCLKNSPFKNNDRDFYIIKKETMWFRNTLFDEERSVKETTLYCYDEKKSRKETFLEREKIACSDEYADIFFIGQNN